MTKEKRHTIIKTENLTIGYRSKKSETVVASSINIALQKGELIGLVGGNGIGKSTLLKTLIKVQKPLHGDLFIHGKSVIDYSDIDLARTLSIVLTEPVISKNLSVLELIALGRQPYTNWIGHLSQTDLDTIQNAINVTQLEDIKHKKCFELSDGQLQKVMIARALAQDTDIIILDEPTTHLDFYHKASVLKLLQKLTKETNKTILFSSHEIDLAIQLCDKMIVMTPNTIHYNTPSALISESVFSNLFPNDLVVFDKQNNRFKIS